MKNKATFVNLLIISTGATSGGRTYVVILGLRRQPPL
jgi:hypothetical protein